MINQTVLESCHTSHLNVIYKNEPTYCVSKISTYFFFTACTSRIEHIDYSQQGHPKFKYSKYGRDNMLR